jgi:WD40 repeat protein
MSEPEQEPILERERRLHEILGAFFEAVEAGEAPNPQDLIAAHPDLADDLAAYFADEARFQHLVAPLHATVGSGAAPADQTATAAFAAEPAPPGANTDATGQLSGDGNGLDPAFPRGSRIRYFGDYELKLILGRGGMGVVYQAKQLSLNRLVALKMIRAGLWAGDDEVRRFQNEAEAVANLDHPRIVTIYEVGQYEGHHYFSMRLVEGSGLEKVLDQHAEDPRRAARLVSEVARAVHHAHQRGILHRDLKPSNILLDGDGHPHVTDFGLAKRLEGNGALSISGSVVGTPQYMSPEQASGSRQAITTATDVYGLGATLYAALTGRPPFQADSLAETLREVREKPVEAPSTINPRVDRDLETIALKCLEKDPKRRYDSAAAVADDLERYLRGEPILARRTGAWERVLKWSRRHPAAAALVGMSGIAALTLVGLGVALAYHSRLQAAYAEKDAALARELTFLYQNRIIFAERELNDNNPHRAEKLLDECPPALRNWEWNYLKRQCHTDLMTIPAHRSHIRSVSISPDGRLIATGAVNDGTVRIWDAKTAREVLALPGHVEGSQVYCSFSPDATRIASVGGTQGRPGQLLIHELATGRVLQRIDLGTGLNASVEFSPDGQVMVIASGEISTLENGKVKRSGWVKTCGTEPGCQPRLFSTNGQPAISASFSPDGARIMAIVGPTMPDDPSMQPQEIRVWDSATKEVRLAKPCPHLKHLESASYSRDGRAIITCGYDSTVRLLGADDGHEVTVLRGHDACTNRAAMSPYGERVASTSDDGSAKIWDMRTGQELLTFRGHRGGFFGVRFTPDGQRLITTGYDGTVKVWDATASPEGRTITASDTHVRSVDFSPDGLRLVTTTFHGELKLWEVPSCRPLDTWKGHTEPVWKVVFSPDGKLIASAAGDWNKPDKLGEVNIWDAATGRVIRPLRAHPGIAWCVAFSPDGRWLVSGGGETHTPGQYVIVWDVSTGTERRRISGLKAGVTVVAFSPDGRWIVAGVWDRIQIWNADTLEERAPFQGHESAMWGLAFTPDGRKLVSGSFDGSFRVWDFRTGQTLQAILASKFQISGIALNRQGNRIASVGSDPTVKLWDTATGQQLISLRGHSLGTAGLYGAAFSPDGHLIATSDSSGVVKLWDGSPWKGD